MKPTGRHAVELDVLPGAVIRRCTQGEARE